MQVQRIDNLFNFTFEKSAADIIDKAKAKALAIASKIEEREGRIRRAREEHKITDAVLLDIMVQSRDQMQRGAMAIAYSTTVRSDDGLRKTSSRSARASSTCCSPSGITSRARRHRSRSST